MTGVSVRASSPALAWTVAAGVAVLAASSFALSFSALAELAIASGVPDHLAFLWPVIVDGFIVVATLAAFSFSARPGRVQLYPWMALGVFAIVSVAGNALHVQTLAPGTVVVADWIAVTVASVPPVALLIASHLLVVMISGRPEVYEPAHVTAQPEAALTVAEPLAQPSRMPNAAWSSRGAHNVAAMAKPTDDARIVNDKRVWSMKPRLSQRLSQSCLKRSVRPRKVISRTSSRYRSASQLQGPRSRLPRRESHRTRVPCRCLQKGLPAHRRSAPRLSPRLTLTAFGRTRSRAGS